MGAGCDAFGLRRRKVCRYTQKARGLIVHHDGRVGTVQDAAREAAPYGAAKGTDAAYLKARWQAVIAKGLRGRTLSLLSAGEYVL
jgi:hypothetical protein